MNERTRQGLIVVGAALALGILGDALLRATPWGLNLLVWIAALAAAGAALGRDGATGRRGDGAKRRGLSSRSVSPSRPLPAVGFAPAGNDPVAPEGRWLLLPILFFAATFAWRDSPTLTLLNSLGLVIALALAALRARSGRFRVAGLADYARDVCVAGLNSAFGIFLLICLDIGWKEIPSSRWTGAARAVGRGLAIAVPLLLLFGGLFVAADAAFEGMVARLFRWDLDALGTQLGRTLLCAWLVGGLLRVMLWAQGDASRAGEPPARFSLGIIEIGVVLGLLDLLFLAFVCVQLRYLFGGAALIAATSGLTCADYARRGFFELVTVTALVLPVLLLAHGLLRKEQPAHEGLFRALATVLLALLAVVMASAVQRMRLYVAAYGLTELRFYTTSFMGWLTLLAFWFFATVLCGRRERFAFGALVTGFLAIATLDGLNPDALIVSANAARVDMVVPMDAEYVSSLSADAVPVLVDALPAMNEAERATAAAQLLSAWAAPSSRDWRTWNWSRAQAWQAIRSQRQILQALAMPAAGRRYSTPPGPGWPALMVAGSGPPLPRAFAASR
jgi:Domain of unknown function (DUF4153)